MKPSSYCNLYQTMPLSSSDPSLEMPGVDMWPPVTVQQQLAAVALCGAREFAHDVLRSTTPMGSDSYW
jgi:hypothetical protein